MIIGTARRPGDPRDSHAREGRARHFPRLRRADRATDLSSRARNGVKILVVEDEAPTSVFLQRGLGEEGFAADVAADAASATEHVAADDYEAILLEPSAPELIRAFTVASRRGRASRRS
jgi:PleD family two-component response regulator